MLTKSVFYIKLDEFWNQLSKLFPARTLKEINVILGTIQKNMGSAQFHRSRYLTAQAALPNYQQFLLAHSKYSVWLL